ncbi:MAG: GAF domain-containing protein [Anaerolineales bacterium]|nr:GAF domain-containing protein [Anaerolineales bacterium]
MKDKAKTKAQLLAEVAALRTRVAELEAAAAAKPIEQHPSQLETLRQIGLELTSELNLEVLLRSIVSRAVELLGGATGSLFLYRPERDVLEVAVTLSGQNIGAILERGEGISGKIWETRQPVIVENYQTWPGRSARFASRDFTTAIGVPIQWGAEFSGGADSGESPHTVWASRGDPARHAGYSGGHCHPQHPVDKLTTTK